MLFDGFRRDFRLILSIVISLDEKGLIVLAFISYEDLEEYKS